MPQPTPVLEALSIDAGYGSVPVIHDVSLNVHAGEVVVLLGSNGAGKTTTLLTLAGRLQPLRGELRCEGRTPPRAVHRRAAAGLRHVPEARAIFPGLSVADNLSLGSGSDPAAALLVFPELQPLLRRPAELLSGGEQQMLVVARALSSRPSILLADELSLGLAPKVVRRLMRAIRQAADELGVAVVLVEQQFRAALQHADRGYVLQRGRVALEDSAARLLERMPEIEQAYLDGVSPTLAQPRTSSSHPISLKTGAPHE